MPEILQYPQLGAEAAIVLIGAAIGAVFLNVIPIIGYPFRRFFTTIHELGHMFVMGWTGDKVKGIEIYFSQKDGARGRAYIDGETFVNPRWVFPAGYMGLTFFCTSLILLSGLPYVAPYVLITIGVFLISVTYLYGLTCSTLLLGFALGGVLIWIGWRAELVWSVLLLNLIAVQGIWTVLGDLQGVIWSLQNDPSTKNDASDMAKETRYSAMFWARTWYYLSIFIIGFAFWFTWLRNMSG